MVPFTRSTESPFQPIFSAPSCTRRVVAPEHRAGDQLQGRLVAARGDASGPHGALGGGREGPASRRPRKQPHVVLGCAAAVRRLPLQAWGDRARYVEARGDGPRPRSHPPSRARSAFRCASCLRLPPPLLTLSVPLSLQVKPAYSPCEAVRARSETLLPVQRDVTSRLPRA